MNPNLCLVHISESWFGDKRMNYYGLHMVGIAFQIGFRFYSSSYTPLHYKQLTFITYVRQTSLFSPGAQIKL